MEMFAERKIRHTIFFIFFSILNWKIKERLSLSTAKKKGKTIHVL